MKTLGLIGGTSWVSTAEYYRMLNEQVNARLGGYNSAKCVIHSFNFAEIVALTSADDWDGLFEKVYKAAVGVRGAGAEALVLCANTMHVVADRVQERMDIPVIHIAEATAEAICRAGHRTTALLGTRFTMEKEFFKERLARHGITTLIPSDDDRAFIHRTIFDELGKDVFLPETKARYVEIISSLQDRGAAGAILGCTEIPLLIKPQDTPAPVFDTTAIHVAAAVDFALA
jgi:aspartate racemase